MDRRWRFWTQMSFTRRLLVVAAVATALRVLAVVLVADVGIDPASDTGAYVSTARHLADGHHFRDFYRSPGYSSFLAVVIWVGRAAGFEGVSLRALAGVVQVPLSVALVVVAALLARRRFASEAAGLVAATLLAVWPNQVLGVGVLMSEKLSTPLFVFAFAVLLWNRFPGRRHLLAGGVLLGAMVLTRGALLPVAVAAAALAWSTRRTYAARLGAVALLALGVGSVVVPWFAYTAHVEGRVTLGAAGGFNLCLGNNDHATGGWNDRAARGRCAQAGPGTSVLDRDRQLYDTAIAWIRDHPGEQPRLVRGRLEEVLGSGDHDTLGNLPSGRRWEGPGDRLVLERWFDAWWFALIVVTCAGAARACTTNGRWVRLWALVFGVAILAIPLVSSGDSRYHEPLVPLMVLVASGVVAKPLRAPARSDLLRPGGVQGGSARMVHGLRPSGTLEHLWIPDPRANGAQGGPG